MRYGFYLHPTNVNVVNFFDLGILEARATWVLGSHPLTRSGLRPYVLLGLGYGDFSAPVETTSTTTDANGSQRISAWKVAGPGFVTTGVGLRIGTDRLALMIAPAKIVAAFGQGSTIGFMPEVVVLGSPF